MRLTEEKLGKIRLRIVTGRLKKADAIRKAVDRIFGKWKMGKFFSLEICDGKFLFERDMKKINAAAMMDGVYVIETTISPDEMNAEEVQKSYKLLQMVERAFRCIKDELEVRPLYHWRERRIRGHVFSGIYGRAEIEDWLENIAGGAASRMGGSAAVAAGLEYCESGQPPRLESTSFRLHA